MIHAWSSPGEIRAAATDGDDLVDFTLERPGAPDHVGALFGATITAKNPTMAGAFMDLGGGLEGFLPDSEGAKAASAGDRLLVRVTRSAQNAKGLRVSARFAPGAPAPEKPGLIAPGPGAIARLAALHPGCEITTDDHALLAALPAPLRARARVAPPPSELLDRVATLASPVASLPGGALATITPTAALVAIDVDTASATGQRLSVEAINTRLIPALARELRLRNLSGGIVIDLAGLSVRARHRLAPALEAALAPDPLAPKFLGFTGLGFAEIVRARIHPPLHELLAGPRAALIAAFRAAVSDPSADTLTAAPDVIGCADPAALADLARRRAPLRLVAAPSLPPGRWTLGRWTLGR